MSDLTTPRTVVIVKEQSNWSTQDRWGSLPLVIASITKMVLGVAAAVIFIALSALGASKHGLIIAVLTGIFAAASVLLAFAFPYVIQRRAYWFWPLIVVAALGWLSAAFSGGAFVRAYSEPQETLRSLPTKEIERRIDALYSRDRIHLEWEKARRYYPISYVRYWYILHPLELEYDEELARRRHHVADVPVEETTIDMIGRYWVSYSSVLLLGLLAIVLVTGLEGHKVILSEPGSGGGPQPAPAAVASASSASTGGSDDTALAALKSWQKDCIQFTTGESEDISLLFAHYENYARWMKAKPYPNANAFSQAWTPDLSLRKIVRGTDGSARKLIGLKLRRDGMSGDIFELMKTSGNGELGQVIT